MLNSRFIVICSALATAISYLSLSNSKLSADDTTRYGAVLICSENQSVDPGTVVPKVVFAKSDADLGWKLVRGEAFTGVDSCRFYFTVEAPGANLSPPTLDIEWKDINVERALGTKIPLETIENRFRVTPTSSSAPTGAFTEIVLGAVHLGVFHNWDVRRTGPYRDGSYPYREVQAQLNYMLGILEVCRAYGWTDSSAPDFVDHLNLYGFETHFPNGHRDYPPHFHIMLGWDGWKAANVGHYHLDKNGSIVNNTYWVLHQDVEYFHKRGEVSSYSDKTGREIFTTQILPDGSGLIIRKTDSSTEYLARAGSQGAYESVEILSRPANSQTDWKRVCETRAVDDASKGQFVSRSNYEDGTVQIIEFNYDPDTGTKR